MIRSRPVLGMTVLLTVAATQLQGRQSRAMEAPVAPWGEHAAVFGINAALGGVTSGILRAARGGSFWEGLAGGAAGGGLVYAGKRITVEHFDGAGFVGREVAAVGNSIVHNMAEGVGMFDHLLVPVGPLPVRLLVAPGAGTPVTPKLDVVSLGSLVYGLVTPRYSLDIGTSLLEGAAVFHESAGRRGRQPPRVPVGEMSEREGRVASAVGSSIFLNADVVSDPIVFAHERVHVIQFDFVLAAWSDRLDDWLLQGVPSVAPYVKLNGLIAAMGMANQTFFLPGERNHLPWEREAIFLSGR